MIAIWLLCVFYLIGSIFTIFYLKDQLAAMTAMRGSWRDTAIEMNKKIGELQERLNGGRT